VQQAVGVERVATAGAVEVEVPAVLGGHRRHLAVFGLGLGAGHAVLGGQVVVEVALLLRRRAGVQLEAVVAHLDLVAVGEPGEGLLEAVLADRAPRADDVRPDLHLHGQVNRRDRDRVP
jgi:hypothetical protein